MGLDRHQPGRVGLAAEGAEDRRQATDAADLGRLLRLATVDDVDLATFVTLSAATGYAAAGLALRWDDLDLIRGVATISRGIVNGLDGLVEKDTKTHQARRVTLDSRHARSPRGAPSGSVRARLGEVEQPWRVRVLPRRAGGAPWYPRLGHPDASVDVAIVRGSKASAARSPPLRGDATARCWGRRADGCWSTRSPQRRHDPERLLHFRPEADRAAATCWRDCSTASGSDLHAR